MAKAQLQVVTSYSLLKSTVRIPELIARAKADAYQAMAITDLNVMHGVVEFYRTAKEAGIKPLIGLTLETRYSLEDEVDTPLILIAKNQKGYENLMVLSTMKMEEYANESLFFERILPYLNNLIVIIDDHSSQLFKFFKEQRDNEFKTHLAQLTQHADENSVYGGISLFGDNPDLASSWAKRLYEAGMQPVALHQVRYMNPSDAFSLTVLNHLEEGSQLAGDTVQKTGTRYLPTSLQMKQAYEQAGLEVALANIEKIVSQCQFEMKFNQTLLPHYELPEGVSPASYLREICSTNLLKRVTNPDSRYQERLDYELSVIEEMGFVDYFLIIWDVMNFAADNKIVIGPGRGSAAGSLVSYLTNITDVDPIQYNLLFERFLNKERYTMPDIDLDIPDNRREEVLAYVNQKYGHHHVAQIATFGTLAAKMALRDVCRVFGLSQNESNAWSSAIPNTLKITLEQSFSESKKLRELVESSERNQLIFEVASKLEGLPRHISTHAAGVVICDQNLSELVPLQEGSNDIPLTQFTMGDVEGIGLLKMDFLGLRNLSILDNTLDKIRRVYKEEVVLEDIPMDDEETLKLFRQSKTVGVFQFESAGIKNVLRKLGPTSIEDIAAVNALYRPGPMENIDLFVERKKGLVPITYPHDSLRDILDVTYGIIVYQEQIMQVVSKMAGFSYGEADILRRAISKKKKDILDQERQHFVKGSLQQGYTEEVANEVYDYIERFANYGFNRSHAMAYSFIAYWLAYLKVHYPAAFFVSLLHSVRHNQEKIKEYINDAKRMGLKIAGPDINQSQFSFYLTKEKIIFGLSAIKGLRADFIKNIVAVRQADGPFKSLDNFLLRVDQRWLKEETILPLIYSGCFDELHPNRHQLVDDLSGLIKNIAISGGSMDLLSILSLKKEEINDYSVPEKLEQEAEYLGTYLSGHPVDAYPSLKVIKGVRSIDLLTADQNATIMLFVRKVNVIRTKKGEQMAFVDGHDASGELSITIFPQLYRHVSEKLAIDKILIISGKAEKSRYNQELQMLAQSVEDTADYQDKIADEVCYIKLTSSDLIDKVKTTCKNHHGIVPVMVIDDVTNKKIIFPESHWVKNSLELKTELKTLVGETNVVVR